MKKARGEISAKRLFAFLFISLLLFASCARTSKEERIASINNSIFCIAVVYKYEGAEKRAATGTGFLVAENLLASAYHVQIDNEKLLRFSQKSEREIVAWKKFGDGALVKIPLELIAFNKEADLAVYRFDAAKLKEQAKERPFKPLAFADRLPEIGEEIVSIGYYGEYEFPFNSLGNVSMIDKNEDIFSDLTLMPGNSGSPLCSVKTGEVFGVNVNVMAIGDGTMRLGIAKRISKLKTLLDKFHENKSN